MAEIEGSEISSFPPMSSRLIDLDSLFSASALIVALDISEVEMFRNRSLRNFFRMQSFPIAVILPCRG